MFRMFSKISDRLQENASQRINQSTGSIKLDKSKNGDLGNVVPHPATRVQFADSRTMNIDQIIGRSDPDSGLHPSGMAALKSKPFPIQICPITNPITNSFRVFVEPSIIFQGCIKVAYGITPSYSNIYSIVAI